MRACIRIYKCKTLEIRVSCSGHNVIHHQEPNSAWDCCTLCWAVWLVGSFAHLTHLQYTEYRGRYIYTHRPLLPVFGGGGGVEDESSSLPQAFIIAL